MNPDPNGFAEAAARAVQEVGSGAGVLMDVRRDDEWVGGHAAAATHWDLARLEANELPEVPKDAQVFVHCAVGGRAGKACGILREQGWTNVTNIGGLSDWQAAGGAVTSE